MEGDPRMLSTHHLTRLLAAATAVVLLAGCGSGASSYTPAGQAGQTPAAATGGATSGGAASAAKTHLVYFNARANEAGERALVDRYMKDHPNIEVEYLSATSLSGPSDTDSIANLIFNIQAKRVIDVAKIE